mmetsp:Transcript_32673/g.73808  ORF Transcript_32673/g.73808 Transcript_32673/m.73808 type:complete len:178 (-) Transcript_32673:369-902(-)
MRVLAPLVSPEALQSAMGEMTEVAEASSPQQEWLRAPVRLSYDDAGRLLHEAMVRCERMDRLRADIFEEEQISSELRPDIKTLQDEISQFLSWIAADGPDGEAYRLSKLLCEEQDRRITLEDEAFRLRGRLSAISSSLHALTQQHAAQAASESAIKSYASVVLHQLEQLRNVHLRRK